MPLILSLKTKLILLGISAFILFLVIGHFIWGRKYEQRVAFYEDGTTQATYQVVWYLNQWVRCGPFVEYYPDGRVRRKGKWYYERLMRHCWTYDTTGTWSREFYRFGSRFGLGEHYYSNNVPWKIIHYQNDVPYGRYVEFHPNGATSVVGYYEFLVDARGQRDWYTSVSNGVWEQWSPDGVLLSQTVWSNGVLVPGAAREQ